MPNTRLREVAAALFLVLVAGMVIAPYVVRNAAEPYFALGRIDEWGTLVILALVLTGLLQVARWYKRLGSNSDIQELCKAAYSYRLGGVLALRPFLRDDGRQLTADSPLKDYVAAIEEPPFLRSPTNPPFVLAVALVLLLGLISFYGTDLAIVRHPSLLLAGPLVAEARWFEDGVATPLPDLILYQSGALFCVAYALMGALLWSIAYLARRMTLRDVTPHAFQTIAVRIMASVIVALFLYHILGRAPAAAPAGGLVAALGDGVGVFGGVAQQLGLSRGGLLISLAFAAGMMPEVALRYLAAKVRKLFGEANGTNNLDLEVVEGIDAGTRVRLAEVGIYDVQGLLTTNPLHLLLKTPFSLPQIMDWVGQGFLFAHLKRERYLAARDQLGLRTIWQLAALPAVARITLAEDRTAELDPTAITGVLGSEPCFVRASELIERMRLRV